MKNAAPRPGHDAWLGQLHLLLHHPERPVGARDHRAIGFHKTLRKADRAAGLDDVGLDREPLPRLRAADPGP